MNEPKWEFAPTGGGVEDGFSDAFIEAFKGDVDRSLARESIQNSIDARLDETKPVRMEFHRIEIDNTQLPGLKQIKLIFGKCLEYYKDDKKVISFFTNATKLIDHEKIDVLKISDYNTIGLRGEDEDKSGEWYCLVKAQGASSKQEEKLGSFGIGKGAPFAASAFHMVFYSTLNDKNQNVFQGQVRLVSHEFEGEIRRGSGSFGLKNQRSIRNIDLIPDLFKRHERGTDINIIGYHGSEKEWHNILIKSILENFWAAILNNDLEIKIGNTYINYESLEDNLLKYWGPEDSDSPYHYYSAFTKPVKSFSAKLKHLGDCKLYIILQEKAIKRIALMRNRMLVKAKPYRSAKPYIGVFICEDKIGNNLLRDMEPPTHNDWEPKRTEKGASILKELDEWVRGCLREMNMSEESDVSSIPGLEKYFQLPEDSDYEGPIENFFKGEYSKKDSVNETQKEIDKIDIMETKVTQRYAEKVLNVSVKSSGGNNKRNRQGTRTKKQRSNNGSGLSDGNVMKFDEIECNIRSYLLNKLNGELEYCVIFEPKANYTGSVKVSAAGDDNDYELELLEAKNTSTNEEYSLKDSQIQDINLIQNEVQKIKLRIKSKNKYSLILK
jgi:hypothetical protein